MRLVWTFLTVLANLGTSYAIANPVPGEISYLGSSVCEECHVEAAEAWRGSHHAKAWTPADAENILGDFEDTTFSHNGITSRFYRDGDSYVIESDGPDGAPTRYPVHSVAGIAPLQQYLLETEPGRLQSFDVTWDAETERWYHLYPDQELYAGNGLHWTGTYKNWNARCAECHATNYDKSYDAQSRTYQSTQSEIGVGCEACHGPGEAHVAWVREGHDPQQTWPLLSETGLTIDMNAGGEALVQQCASCHARREPFAGGSPLPGTGFHDAYRLSLLRDGTYHADGQILDEVYVYGSFLQSKMYSRGVTCNDCHDPHRADLRLTGNAVCTQCHSEVGNGRFPTLTLADYDTPAHHFHETGSDGAQCVSCHMIERDYMGIDGRRDHSFRVPRPDLSVETRSPNACTDCHAEQGSSWAAAAIESWYPDSLHRGPHFGQTLALGRRDLVAAIDPLVALALDTEMPGIARATALDMLTAMSAPELADRLTSTLDDPDPLVRAAAIGAQSGAPPDVRPGRLIPRLSDPVKSVRIAAAREFLSLPGLQLASDEQAAVQRAFAEWQDTLAVKTDFPETQLVLGGVALTTRRWEAALAAFSEAVTLDPQMEQAWIMQVRILAALGDRAAARATAEAALLANPGSIPLSLLRAEL